MTEITKQNNSDLQEILNSSLDLKMIQSKSVRDSLISLGYKEDKINQAIEGLILQATDIDPEKRKKLSSLSVYTAIRNAINLGLDCSKSSGEAYFIPYGSSLQLVTGYKAYRNKAYENGFKIEADVVTHKEYSNGDFKMINGEYFHNSLERIVSNVIPTVPQVKSKIGSVNFINELQQKADYRDTDIRFVYAVATDTKTGVKFMGKPLSIVDVVEKSVKKTKDGKRYVADGIVKKAFEGEEDRLTDVIKMFQKAAIRSICSELPNTHIIKFVSDADHAEEIELKESNVLLDASNNSKFTELPPEDNIKPINEPQAVPEENAADSKAQNSNNADQLAAGELEFSKDNDKN